MKDRLAGTNPEGFTADASGTGADWVPSHVLAAPFDDIAATRGLTLQWEPRLDQAAVAMDIGLTELLGKHHKMTSGAGHDAMIVARRMPTAMLFLRSPGGISHHPDEAVIEGDVAAALGAGLAFLDALAGTNA